MKKINLMLALASVATLCTMTSCNKNSNDVWDDSNSLGSYRRASQRVLWGDSNSANTQVAQADGSSGVAFSKDEEFIPLKEEDLKQQFSDLAVPQPKSSPGEEGSYLPGIDGFKIPTSSLASVFRTVHFNTDEYVLKKSEDLQSVDRMAAYLKAHPKTYIFVAGHCDQRGPEAYNLALGTRRANYVRSLLVQKGVNPEQIHTISYGKEHLLDGQNTQNAWAKNRRAEFRIYQQH